MPVTITYPGVYIQELPSAVHPITGVATSITAFVGYTARGIDHRAEHIFSFADYERLFGGLDSDSEVSYAVQQFFANGGTEAYVVRVPRTKAKYADVEFGGLTFTALSSGTWTDGQLFLDVDYNGVDQAADPTAFNLTVTSLADGTVETFPNLSLKTDQKNFVKAVINDEDNGSQLVGVTVPSSPPTNAPPQTGIVGSAPNMSGVNTGANGYGISLTTSSPAPAAPFPFDVPVFAQGSAIPQSVSGLAAKLQQAINSLLSLKLPGASVQCSVSGPTGSQVIRVNALLPKIPDAVISFGPPSGTSGLADVSGALGLNPPASSNVAHYALGTGHAWPQQTASNPGTDGPLPGTRDLIGDSASFQGIYALEKVDLFNLLSIPDATRASASDPSALDSSVADYNEIYSTAIALCDRKRAFLLLDSPPNVNTVSAAVDWKTAGLTVHDKNGAAFFPRLRLPDPLNNFQLRTFAPSGVVAGLYARTDSTRGVFKAPAGTEATLSGVQALVFKLSDAENGALNPLGLNCFRTFPVYGSVLWGRERWSGQTQKGTSGSMCRCGE